MSLLRNTYFAILDDALIEDLWDVYREAFGSKKDCIEVQQCYTEEVFKAAMRDPEYVKFTIQDAAGRALALHLVTGNLQKVSKVIPVNVEHLKALYPVEAQEGRLWYVTALAVRPGQQGLGISSKVFELTVAYGVQNRLIYGFDYTVDSGPGFAEYVLQQSQKAITNQHLPATADYKEFGGQHYGAIVFSFPKDPASDPNP